MPQRATTASHCVYNYPDKSGIELTVYSDGDWFYSDIHMLNRAKTRRVRTEADLIEFLADVQGGIHLRNYKLNLFAQVLADVNS